MTDINLDSTRLRAQGRQRQNGDQGERHRDWQMTGSECATAVCRVTLLLFYFFLSIFPEIFTDFIQKGLYPPIAVLKLEKLRHEIEVKAFQMTKTHAFSWP